MRLIYGENKPHKIALILLLAWWRIPDSSLLRASFLKPTICSEAAKLMQYLS